MVENDAAPRETNSPVAARRGRFSTNLAWNFANFIVNIAVGVWIVDYLIKNLGVAGYALIPLVLQVMPYLQIITLSVNAAVGRYLTIAIEQGDNDRANRVFNTALFALTALGAVLFVAGLAFAYFSPWLLNVDPGLGRQTQYLCLFAVAGFMLAELTLPFGVSMFARNRFDVQNMVNVAATLLRIGTLVALFTMFVPQVWHVGVSLLVANAVTAIGAIWACRKLTPMLRVWRGHYDRTMLKDLTKIGSWIVVNQIGMLLFLSIDLIVVNRMFGNEAGGKYAAILTWSALLRQLAGTIAGVFGPTVVMLHARNDTDGIVSYVRRAMKMMGLAMALPIGIICGFAGPILNVWIGPDFVPLAALMSLMTIHLCVNLTVLPLFNVQQATNNVKWPGITMIVAGVLNLGLAIFLAGKMQWGLFGVAAAGAIVLSLKNAVFTPIYNAWILKKPFVTFFGELFQSVLVTFSIAGACILIARIFDLSSFVSLAFWALSVSAIYAALVYVFVLRKSNILHGLRAPTADDIAKTSATNDKGSLGWKAAFGILLLFNLYVIGRDLLPRLDQKLSRKHMATTVSDKEYFEKVRHVAINWLRKPPRVPVNDEKRLLFLDDFVRQERENSIWNQSILAKGIIRAYQYEANDDDITAVEDYCSSLLRSDYKLADKPSEIDEAAIGESFLFLAKATGKVRYRLVATELRDYVIQRFRNEGGAIGYRKKDPHERLVDAIGMMCPFMSLYGVQMRDEESQRCALVQLKDILDGGIDQNSGLPFHGIGGPKKLPIGLVGWGRGTGWLLVGLIDTYRNQPSEALNSAVQKFARTIAGYQRQDGSWQTQLTSESADDSSALAMIGYFLQSAINLGCIDSQYQANVDRCVAKLKSLTRIDGTVDYAEGVVLDYDRHSELRQPLPVAQGMALALMSQYLGRKQ